jgi:hypothetical protein
MPLTESGGSDAHLNRADGAGEMEASIVLSEGVTQLFRSGGKDAVESEGNSSSYLKAYFVPTRILKTQTSPDPLLQR